MLATTTLCIDIATRNMRVIYEVFQRLQINSGLSNNPQFFISYPDRSITLKYNEEVSTEWLYFLKVCKEICFWYCNKGGGWSFYGHSVFSHFYYWRPRNWKTCILLNLLKYFADLGYDVRIVLSDNLTHYVEASTEANISQYRVSLNAICSLDFLLIDDPAHCDLMTY